MKAILMSIRPEWVAKILNGEKTVEIRKKFPKDYVGWVYIYCCKNKPNLYRHFKGEFLLLKETKKICLWNGKVVARFWCDNVEELMFLEGLYSTLDRGYCTDTLDNAQVEIKSHVPQESIIDYLYSKGKGYAIHITKLEIFDIPKEISGFFTVMGTHKPSYMLEKAPQSWCYIEV